MNLSFYGSLGIRLVVSCVLLVLASGERAAAQCTVRSSLEAAARQGCLAKAQVEQLRGFLEKPSAEDTREKELLKSTSDAFQCLLESGSDPSEYACFRNILRESLYPNLPKKSLCVNDRLAQAVIGLRYAAEQELATREPLTFDQIIDPPLNAFATAFAICREIKSDPDAFTSVHLAGRGCIDLAEPAPPAVYVQELIDVTVKLVAESPDLGKHVGAVLDGILADAIQLYEGDVSIALASDYALLIELDDANLTGTSFFYLAKKTLGSIFPEPEEVAPSELSRFLESSEKEKVEEYVNEVGQRMQRKSRAYRPFDWYGDFLYAGAEHLKLLPDERPTRDRLVRLACATLRDGLRLSVPAATEDELEVVQDKLVDRIRDYGLELGRDLRYSELADFQSGFLDESAPILPESRQCYIHAHLAQAFYLLNDLRNATEHLERSCDLVTFKDLTRLRSSVESWM